MNEETYDKFISLSLESEDGDTGETLYCYNLESLAKVVDIAYAEGRMSHIRDCDGYDEDVEAIEELESLNNRIEEILAPPQEEVDVE